MPRGRGELAVVATMAARRPSTMRPTRSPLDLALAAAGWARVAVLPTGEIVEANHRAREIWRRDGVALDVGCSLALLPWFRRVRAQLAENDLARARSEPDVQAFRVDGLSLVVERPEVGLVAIHFHDSSAGAGVGSGATLPDTTSKVTLTPRQAQIARLLVEGLSAREISELLDISLATARSHIENLYRRLRVHNRAQVVAQLVALGEG